MGTYYLSAYYTDDQQLLSGLKKLKEEGIRIADVLTPFPVHGIDKVLQIKRSRISRVGFVAGAIGGISGFVFQAWTFTRSYPLNIGGKPFLSVPSFIPVVFECTVLFAAIAMVFAYLFRTKLGFGAKHINYDERITDDRFLVLVDIDNNPSEANVGRISDKLSKAGAMGVTLRNTDNEKNFTG
jgi:hypothetical protein